MRKVIGFDSWTGGAVNWERLTAAFVCRGIDFFVIHIGAWGGDLNRPQKEKIGEIEFRNITYYETNHFSKILNVEKPDAVLFLSTDTFAHRAFNRHCIKRNIPTLHLYHGLVSVQDVGTTQQYKVNFFAQLRFVLDRIPKAIWNVWPAYAMSMFATGARIKDWVRFGQDIIYGAIGKRLPHSAPDAKTDECCVYVNADVDHAVEKYGFEREEVTAVGNPDLAKFGLDAELIGSALGANLADHGNVMYIDTGLIYTGYVYESPEKFIRHLIETKLQLALHGKRLLFKPHPDHFRTEMPAKLAAAGIEVCSNTDFVPRLKGCCASIVEPSTLSLVPALMGMPLFLAQYGKLSEQKYGKVLTGYPRAISLSVLDEFHTLLSAAENNCDANATRAWINQNAGPLPATKMPDRVVDVVEIMINQCSAGSSRQKWKDLTAKVGV